MRLGNRAYCKWYLNPLICHLGCVINLGLLGCSGRGCPGFGVSRLVQAKDETPQKGRTSKNPLSLVLSPPTPTNIKYSDSVVSYNIVEYSTILSIRGGGGWGGLTLGGGD